MTLTKDSEEQLAIVEIKGRPNIIEIQQELIDAVEFIKDQELELALLDTRKMEVMFTLSLYWYRMRWFPLARESGLKYLAVVLPEIFAEKSNLRKLNETGGKLQEIRFRFFLDIDQARNWLSRLGH